MTFDPDYDLQDDDVCLEDSAGEPIIFEPIMEAS